MDEKTYDVGAGITSIAMVFFLLVACIGFVAALMIWRGYL